MKRLLRDREERMVAGVASGLAVYWEIDPILVRAGLAGLCIFGGAGFVLYAAGWVLMPEAPREEGGEPDPALIPGHPIAAVGVTLLCLGCVALVRAMVPWIAHQPVWPLALIGLGGLLLMAKR